MKKLNEIKHDLKVFLVIIIFILSCFVLIDPLEWLKFISDSISKDDKLFYCFFRSLSFIFLNVVAINMYANKTRSSDKNASFVLSYLLNVVMVSAIISVVYFCFEYLFSSYYSHLGNDFSKLFKYESISLDSELKEVKEPLDAGQVGDYFGGILNPIVGFFSLIILSMTLIVIHKSMNNAKESSDEFKNQFLNQRFEDTFFSMLNVFINMSDKVYEIRDINNNDYGTDQRSFISDAYCELIIKYNECSRNALLSSHKDINSLFRMMYQILKHVDEHFFFGVDDKAEKELIENQLKKAKKYTNIVRSTLDSDTYHLLLLNCMVNDGSFMSYKKYLAKYAFIEHITLDQKTSEVEYLAFLRAVKVSYCNDEYKSAFGDQAGLLEAFFSKPVDTPPQTTP